MRAPPSGPSLNLISIWGTTSKYYHVVGWGFNIWTWGTPFSPHQPLICPAFCQPHHPALLFKVRFRRASAGQAGSGSSHSPAPSHPGDPCCGGNPWPFRFPIPLTRGRDTFKTKSNQVIPHSTAWLLRSFWGLSTWTPAPHCLCGSSHSVLRCLRQMSALPTFGLNLCRRHPPMATV